MSSAEEQIKPKVKKMIKLVKEMVTNKPYLPLINYRIGNYTTFKHSMIESIKSDDTILKEKWTDYSSSNDGVVLIEMWAYLLDILSYYQERIANEVFIRTAQLRESVIRQCKLIDYKINPGVSAATFVQFTAEKDRKAIVPKGFKLQTKPISGKEPLTFETDESITISSSLNEIGISLPMTNYNLQRGAKIRGDYSHRLKPGDYILVTKDYHFRWKEIPGLESEALKRFLEAQFGIQWPVHTTITMINDNTAIRVSAPSGHPYCIIQLDPEKASARLEIEINGNIQSYYKFAAKVGDGGQLTLYGEVTGLQPSDYAVTKLVNVSHVKDVTYLSWKDTGDAFESDTSRIFYLSTSMHIFGYNAPSYSILQRLYKETDYATKFASPGVLPGHKSENKDENMIPSDNLRLDKVYERLNISEYAAVVDQEKVAANLGNRSIQLFKIKDITEQTAIAYSLSSKVTVLVTDRNLPIEVTDPTNGFKIRTTTVMGKPEELPHIRMGIAESLRKIRPQVDNEPSINDEQQTLVLDGIYLELKEGMYICLTDTGQITPSGLNPATEIHRITAVTKSPNGLSTMLKVGESFEHEFDKVTTKINANVVPVSHGETIKDEILGSGNASEHYQTFILKESPVTFTPSALSNTGAKSSLEIFIANMRWEEVEGFMNSTPTDKHYITSINEQDKTVVKFGNGRYGSLLPTGMDNIHAKYRKGIGTAGNFAYPGTITVVMGTNPAVKSVTNPLGASGGEDKENEDDARITAPRSLKALNRAVSIEDYENLALSYSGISKAKAYSVSFQGGMDAGRPGTVRIIVAPKGGGPVTDILKKNLRGYLDLRRDSNISLKIEDFKYVDISIKAKIKVKDQYLQLAVKKAVEIALGDTTNEDGTYNFFAFDNLNFGQTIHLSDVYSEIAKIEGVEYAIVEEFNKSSEIALKPLSSYVMIKENEIAKRDVLGISAEGGIIQ